LNGTTLQGTLLQEHHANEGCPEELLFHFDTSHNQMSASKCKEENPRIIDVGKTGSKCL
jgi:DNA-directed RNA polymerase